MRKTSAMEGKSANISNSNFMGNLVQGEVQGDVEAHIKPESGSQSNSDTHNNDLRSANIGNFANKVSDNARQQTNQHIHVTEKNTTLAEAAKEIQQLLDQLSQNYPTTTVADKATVAAKAMEEIEKKPDTKGKIIKAVQAGGIAALIELTNNPVVRILAPMLESLLEET